MVDEIVANLSWDATTESKFSTTNLDNQIITKNPNTRG